MFSNPKFILKLKRVLLLTAGLILAGIYLNTIIHVSIIMGHGTLDHSYGEMILTTIGEVLFAGLILASVEVFYFTDRFRKRSFSYAVISKSLFYLFGMVVLVFVITLVETLFAEGFTFTNMKNITEAYIKKLDIVLLTNFIPWGPIFLICVILLQVSDKFGQGVFLKFISGKYHTPKEEVRIFMFLDLKSSTSIAEALGNIKYFELINDFFYDATDSIIESKGEIYQYVGDEIVISWELNNGVSDANCLQCFFKISEAVKKASEKYETKYGLVPSFKAGIHYGQVTVGEVGLLKKEIAFSGDVLNTAARIQELCNKYNQKLLVSKDILDLVKVNESLLVNEIGQMNLRGRATPVILYSVKKANLTT